MNLTGSMRKAILYFVRFHSERSINVNNFLRFLNVCEMTKNSQGISYSSLKLENHPTDHVIVVPSFIGSYKMPNMNDNVNKDTVPFINDKI